ncbi:Hypothetical predicted protein [Octopus vulgaris]|uniref:STPR domain-containing protein n=1 Tax=Octopus vulgaris TaxID=6645 RepID=A0AA36B8Q0_OCTVU|nr:Hypothetical predicted protein [Octopus vulgaris]
MKRPKKYAAEEDLAAKAQRQTERRATESDETRAKRPKQMSDYAQRHRHDSVSATHDRVFRVSREENILLQNKTLSQLPELVTVQLPY